ncbi:MAG: 4-alpha-glucanotransferase [Treponema sp.]
MESNNKDEQKPTAVFPYDKRTGIVVPLGALYSKKYPAIGEFPALTEFVQFCKKAGLTIIQLLPVNDTGTQSSPYSGLSAFALHPIYISLTYLPEFSKVLSSDKQFAQKYNDFINNNPYKHRYNYDTILNTKIELLHILYESTEIAKTGKPSAELTAWIKKNQWIIPYAVYKNLKWKYMQATWKSWKSADRVITDREIAARWDKADDKKENLFYAWTQMRAAQQFIYAASEVRKAGIILKGDIPILMNEDSCDAWSQSQIFNQSLRAGAPVDGENLKGQNWGFPTYNWKYLKSTDYAWWKERLVSAAQYYDAYRLDHILGFFRIWAVPERDTTAVLGHTDPYKAITREKLHEAGFDNGRIRWLSQPHVQTGVIQDITWNYDIAHKILATCMTQLPNEELWIFNPTIRGDKDIYELNFGNLCSDDAAMRIKERLAQLWLNRCLIEVEKDMFVPLWTYTSSTSWATLSDAEKQKLQNVFVSLADDEQKLWKKQASDILKALTNSVNMVACGEDLGVNLPCLPPVMKDNTILSLRVVRWAREWNKDGQPYIPFSEYPSLSVTTTSVHDSPTIREWWEQDAYAASLFAKTYPDSFDSQKKLYKFFTPETARCILSAAAAAGSMWCIHPLQDFLYMNKSYWLEKPSDERINIPGTVSPFNWTYRMPVPIETIEKDDELILNIKTIVEKHSGGSK